MGSLPWEVSALGFGCMRLPRSRFLPTIDEKRSIEIIRHGIDRGINFIDTAWLYPQSESVIGNALTGGYREKVHIATKLPMILVRKKDDFDRYLDDSLRRMRTDSIDVYLFHMLNQVTFSKVRKLDLIEKMERAKKAGKIKHIGFSFHDTLPDFYPWEMTLIQYNYMDMATQATTEGLRLAHSKGIAVVVMEPLKGGQLVNPPPEARNIINAAAVRRSPVDWALQFLWNRPEIACVLSGMNSRKMVDENCDCAGRSGANALSKEECDVIGSLAEVYRRKIVVPCTACKYCMPCPSGVNIPQCFALLNNKSLMAYGNASFRLSMSNVASRMTGWLITSNYRKLARSKGRLNQARDNGRASLCTGCNACLPKCPQKIDIPNGLEKVAAVFERRKSLDSVRQDAL
jgi:predicted aldo/keto reductase-like oxidoreductase